MTQINLKWRPVLIAGLLALPFNTLTATPPPISTLRQDTSITQDFLMGRFNPARHKNFVRVAKRYASHSGLYLQKEAYQAYKAMRKAARKGGVHLTIRSATRTSHRQKSIWERKWRRSNIRNAAARSRNILKYSSMPGASRHHWGTEVDLNAFNNRYFSRGRGKKEYNWLRKNAGRFGFCQPYTAKGAQRPHGYSEERWHWSYRPLSKRYTNQVRIRIFDDMFSGFKGSKTAKSIAMVDRYMLGINPACY